MSETTRALVALAVYAAFFGAVWLFLRRAYPTRKPSRRTGYTSLPDVPSSPVTRIAVADGSLVAFTADAVYAWDDVASAWRRHPHAYTATISWLPPADHDPGDEDRR